MQLSGKLRRLENELGVVRAAVADRPADDFQRGIASLRKHRGERILAGDKRDAWLLVGLRVGGEDSELHRRSGQRAGEFHDIGTGSEALHQGINTPSVWSVAKAAISFGVGPFPKSSRTARSRRWYAGTSGGQREFAGEAGLDVAPAANRSR